MGETRRYLVRVEYLIEHDDDEAGRAIRSASYAIPQSARDVKLATIHSKRIEPKPTPKVDLIPDVHEAPEQPAAADLQEANQAQQEAGGIPF